MRWGSQRLEKMNHLERLRELEKSEHIPQDDIRHELYMLGCDRRRLEQEVDEAVEALFRAKSHVQEIDKFIEKVRGYCEHDQEETGTSPNGSFTVIYFKCKKCGKAWSDD